MTPQLQQLLFYASNDWPIFPCGRDKTPLTEHGFKDATTNAEQIQKWYRDMPGALWGIATGAKKDGGAGIAVIDIDIDHEAGKNGFVTWEALRDEHSDPIETVTAKTRRGGRHLIFNYPDGHVVTSRANVLGEGIDVRAKGGYIIAAPSDGWSYELSPEDTPLMDLPEWILRRVNGRMESTTQTPGAKRTESHAEPIEDFAQALAALNALSKIRADNYDQWLHVGMSLRSLGSDGLLLWDNWSRQSDKYEPGKCAQKWESFTDERMDADKITLASLFHWAEKDGAAPFIRPCPKDAKPADYAKALTALGWKFSLNEMNDEVFVNGRRWTDPLYAKVMNSLRAHQYKSIEYAKDTMLEMGLDNQFHPVREYLNSLEWESYELDGKTHHPDHIANLACFFQDKDSIFPVLLRKWLIGAVARILKPGNQDLQNPVVVLDGAQGIGKSRFVWWLASPLPAFYYQGAIVADDKDSQIRQCSVFVWELEELGSTFRRSDLNSLKAFLTHPTVRVRVSYGKRDIIKPVTASYIGTINNVAGFLADPTGNRRFRTCTLTSIDWSYDSNIDINQIWAQAVALFRAGETPQLDKETEARMREINSQYEVDDPIAPAIFKWFNIEPGNADKTITVNEMIKELRSTGDVVGEGDRAVAMRIANVLHQCGCEKVTTRINGKQVRAWQGVWAKGITPPKGDAE
ncbi:MAG: bifunctional DNA primase/polymerase [Chloroflexota bacterium]|nr:bifunctional DNA primase/polymerase [Chloroflexota bacterium]